MDTEDSWLCMENGTTSLGLGYQSDVISLYVTIFVSKIILLYKAASINNARPLDVSKATENPRVNLRVDKPTRLK